MKEIDKEENSITRRDFLKLAICLPLLRLADKISINEDENEVVIFRRVEINSPFYALTIDDCWLPDVFKEMLDVLDEKEVRVDFFPVGVAVLNLENKMPGIWQRVANEGHKIGYHTMYHNDESPYLSTREYIEDFDLWKRSLVSVMGEKNLEKSFSGLARAVGGYFSPQFLSFCRIKGLIPCGWSITPTPENFRQGHKVRPGDIVLYHVRKTDLEYLRWLLSEPGIKLNATDINSLILLKEENEKNKSISNKLIID